MKHSKNFYYILVTILLTVSVMIFNKEGYTAVLSLFSPDYDSDMIVSAPLGTYTGSDTKVRIDLSENLLYVYHNDKLTDCFPVSGGAARTPTPLGKWYVISKNTQNEQSGSPYFVLNVPWNTLGIYGTKEVWSIGKNICSESCILIKDEDMQKLFQAVACGSEVEIYQKDPPFRDMKEGSSGSDVLEVQKALLQLRLYDGALDGVYSPAFRSSVLAYQKTHALYPTGEINISTYRRILESTRM